MKQSLGIYIHIPFCIKKCHYCDFCSVSGTDDSARLAYTEELCRRMEAAAPLCGDRLVDTVYFGGGTPTLLPLTAFERLTELLFTRFNVSTDCEITCECNPATADLAYLSALRALGINRLSLGLQSVHDRELSTLGRAHTFADFRAVLNDARKAGFDNVSADLMYALPDQTLADFRQSLEMLASMGPEHISAYGLKIEEGTPFAAMRNSLRLPDEEEELAMYLLCGELLSRFGYEKYEISNFARPGRCSRHNLRYWQGLDYLGFGVAAHSCFGNERFGNSRDLAAFLGGEDVTEERIPLTDRDKNEEFLMLRLRLTEGISESELHRRIGMTFSDYYPNAEQLIDLGLMQRKNGRISFTDRGFFVSNAILADLPELPQ